VFIYLFVLFIIISYNNLVVLTSSCYTNHGEWLRRLGSLKATNLKETMNVMNEIIELFNLLENSCMNKSNMEKITIMYNALPNILKDKILMSSQYTPETLYEIIKDRYTVIRYQMEYNNNQTHNQRNSNFNPRNIRRNNNPFINNFKNSNNDYMDIDNIEGKRSKGNRRNTKQYHRNKY
ncbi:hypothetical protein BCR36DRAFT_466245, partial [Piromyces finnis]